MLPLSVHTLAGETFLFPELRHTNVLLALGPPGGGKGTDFKHCVGTLLEKRSACVITQSAILTSAQLDSAFSIAHRRIIAHSLANDILTPDHIAMNVLGRELALRLDGGVEYDFVAIDGGGRSLGQALGLANSGAKIYVINLEYSDADEELLLARMQSRARNPRELDPHYNLQRLRQFEEVTVPGITKLRTLVSSMQWLDVPCSLEKEERHRLEMQFLNRAFGLVETVEAVAA